MRFFFLFSAVLCGVLAGTQPAGAQAGQPQDPTAGLRQNTPQLLWLDTSAATRAGIVAAWQNLPPTTRPPFPVFRDKSLRNGDGATPATARTAKK